MTYAKKILESLSLSEKSEEYDDECKKHIFTILGQYKNGDMSDVDALEALADILQHHDVSVSKVHDIVDDMPVPSDMPSAKDEALSPRAKKNVKRGALGAAALGAGVLGHHYGAHHMLAHALMNHPWVQAAAPGAPDIQSSGTIGDPGTPEKTRIWTAPQTSPIQGSGDVQQPGPTSNARRLSGRDLDLRKLTPKR